MTPSKASSRFQADLKSAMERSHPEISDVKKGDASDEFTFIFSFQSASGPLRVKICVLPQDVRGYPDFNCFLAYTDNDVPQAVAQVLEESLVETKGMRVEKFLDIISKKIRIALEPEIEEDIAMVDPDGIESDECPIDDTDDDASIDDGDDDNIYDDAFSIQTFRIPQAPRVSPLQPAISLSPALLGRVRRDLRSVVDAGFHTGRVYGLEDKKHETVISISIRVNKLGLSKETREAWDLASSGYIVLLIQYVRGYRTFEDVLERSVGSACLKFRLRKCNSKKPPTQQAAETFSGDNVSLGGPELLPTWISASIEEFMNNEFIPLLKMRKRYGGSWESANELLRSRIFDPGVDSLPDAAPDHVDVGEAIGNNIEEPTNEAKLPTCIANDHFLSDGELSLPLLAAQFALRYLVRCTDYCTACHRKMEGNFEAIKPYVCDRPLCLHQYMNLGFGPSIDSEIINRPQVVDLLISFCYASICCDAYSKRVGMREFPTGLGLQVPKIRLKKGSTTYSKIHGGELVDPKNVVFNWDESTAMLPPEDDNINLSEGQWVVIVTQTGAAGTSSPTIVLHHAHIVSRSGLILLLDVASRHTLPYMSRPILDGTTYKRQTPNESSASLVLYNDDLDDLNDQYEQAFSMMLVLAALPSVDDMRSYLMSSGSPPLNKWGRMSRGSVDLLRWIVASNRSYIVQVDDTRSHERIRGVEGWIQFRFAQGSREKEVLFNEALKGIDKPQKTLVAWHGSALENWHSIIRQGLNYDISLHGRSFGNGIYFARDFDYSRTYTNSAHMAIWPQSALQVQGAISLNELVNDTNSFVNTNPFFVVQHCHWTQCRYLFVQTTANPAGTNVKQTTNKKTQGGGIYEVPKFIQDPEWIATGPKKTRLDIPQYAIRFTHEVPAGSFTADMEEPEMITSDEDEQDAEFLSRDDGASATKLTCETNFCPGTLDFSTLPLLAEPSFATGTAQKALGLELKKLEKVQSSTPLHQLGWYIDFDKIDNMFQWIVELHSFDPDLPLAKDMESAGVTSIVLELRFLRGFPMSPPFVRVIRPRFLPFMHGGGGHVTAGGAMCMELLTNSGWSPANDIESILLQVRMAICSVDPQPARLEKPLNKNRQYSVGEAIDAYIRAAAVHGWEVPDDFRSMSA
ncbi:uncharacterized protein F4822DRAFT_262536 [Hypoxylon trugodes]|uniref:uncharacterized protein n=1 Tax=Hypoxylon trugodes TaxID=326681 RepID=UPI00219C137C|nr:uncharacterized protein F4822DRAFT_262536 [Hypoxylon trugodes]KAI1388932.1 hypothetical protein F4822DRAFT_262536 [Hypoxylon trugodes]